jgi:hypothetical protein
VFFSCYSGLPDIRGYSGVHDDLHGRRDRAERADVTLGGVITTSRLSAVVLKSSASPPRRILSQAGARQQDRR